ncbi:MAG: hypothetical protein RR346_01710 [Bacteroidales bacterium]
MNLNPATNIPVFYTSDALSFEKQADDILIQLKQKERIMRLVFFGETEEQNYEQELASLKQRLIRIWGEEHPLLTYITQPVLGSKRLAAEVHYQLEEFSKIRPVFKQMNDIRYILLEDKDKKILLTEGVRKGDSISTAGTQSKKIFEEIEAILSTENFNIRDIVRQWNYIENITGFKDGIQNYQALNDARSVFYGNTEWSEGGYPAATGIGMEYGGIIVELIAIQAKNNYTNIYPIDNPRQIAAHSYSQDVLLGKEDRILKEKSTPKFERAKAVSTPTGYTCFISGTAAIRGELSLEEMDGAQQTELTIENIEHLISINNIRKTGMPATNHGKLDTIRVYIKDPKDYPEIHRKVESYWPSVPALYVKADICRTELLVEIEGIAQNRYQ